MSNTGMSPARDGEVFDSIEFDSVTSPGVCRLTGHEREIKLDVKDSDGQHGATTTFKGTKCGSFTATFTLGWDPAAGVDDFTAWDDFAQRLWSTVPPASGKTPVAKDIWHPDLERNGYNSVILQKMGGMQHDGKGGATIAVELAEYFPPRAATTGSSAGSKKNAENPNDPLVVARKELEGLLAEGNKTP
jgi:hypothetical protein